MEYVTDEMYAKIREKEEREERAADRAREKEAREQEKEYDLFLLNSLGCDRTPLKGGQAESSLPKPSSRNDSAKTGQPKAVSQEEAERTIQKAERDIIAYKQRNPDLVIGAKLDDLAADARQALLKGEPRLAQAVCMSIDTLIARPIPLVPQQDAASSLPKTLSRNDGAINDQPQVVPQEEAGGKVQQTDPIQPNSQRVAVSTALVKQAMAAVKGYMAKPENERDAKVLKTLTGKLREAQQLRNGNKLDEADLACQYIIAESQKAVLKAVEQPLSKAEQKAKTAKEAKALAERQLDLNLAVVGEEMGPEVAEIMDRHCLLEPTETAAFAGLRWMDDLLAIPKDKRGARVKGIREAVTDARARQQQMAQAVANVGALATPEGKEALTLALKFQANMMNHIPAAFVNERDLDARLRVLETVADLDPDERQRRKELAKTISLEDQADEKKAFVDAITQGALKPSDQVKFFFDGPVRPLTSDQQKTVFEAQEKIIARAHEIKDLGGSVKEVEAALAHIPAEFWPPEFIQKLQGWRKVEREIAEERAVDIFKKPEKLGDLSKAEILSGAAGILDTVGALVSILGGVSDFDKIMEQSAAIQNLVSSGMTPEAAAKDPSVTGITGPLGGQEALYLRMVVEASADIAKDMDPIVGYIKSGNTDQLQNLMRSDAKTRENVLTIVSKTDSVISKLNNSGLRNIPQLASALPMMSAISTGIDFAKACYQLKQCLEATGSAGDLKEKASLDFYSGKSDDEALLNALINERNAQEQRTIKKGVEVAARGVSTAGDVLKTVPEHHAKAAGYAIKVVGKTLEVGNKVVFAGIEWSQAKKAMKTLKAAQAGNPQARIEIFENCALYAKMYLAVLAQEKNPLAQQLIVDRGLTEGDLSKPMALQLLRDNLMKKAEQRNEVKVHDGGTILSDGLFTEAGTRVIKASGQSIKGAAISVKSKLIRLKGEPETPPWTPPAAKLEVADFEKVRQDAVQNGLDDAAELNQIAEAMRQIDAAFERAMEASKPTTTDADFPDGSKALTIIRAKLALIDLTDILEAYTPTSDGATSEPMATYLHGLYKLADARTSVVVDLLKALDRKPWQPGNGAKDAGGWAADWSSAVIACPGLTKDDGGVKKALEAYQKQKTAAGEKDKPSKARAARIKARDELENVAAALNACFKECGEYDEVREFLDGWLEWVTKESQEESGDLYDEKLPDDSLLGDRAFTAEGWGELFKTAAETGLLDMGEGDHGLSKAYSKVEKRKAELEEADRENKDLQHGKQVAKARAGLIEAQVEVVKASTKIARGNLEAPKQVADHLGEVSKKAKGEVGELRDKFAEVQFPTTAGLKKSAWKTTYGKAVHEGAVPENKDAYEGLAKALANYESARSDFDKEKNAEKKMAAAGKVQRKAKRVKEALLRTGNKPGFDHPILKTYFADLKTALDTDLAKEDLKDVLSGKAATKDPFPTKASQCIVENWEIIKPDAVAAGVIPDAFTGFTNCGKKVVEYAEAWRGAKRGSKAKDKALVKLDFYLTKLEGIIKGIVSKCEHAGMARYMNGVVAGLNSLRQEMATSVTK